MPPALIIAGAGLAVSAVGTIASISASTKAANRARDAQALDSQRQDLQAAVQRRDAIRSSRVAYAQSQQAAENQGSGETSASQGGLSSIGSQINSNLSFLDKYSTLTDQASEKLGESAKYTSQAQTATAIAGFGEKIFSNSGSLAKLGK